MNQKKLACEPQFWCQSIVIEQLLLVCDRTACGYPAVIGIPTLAEQSLGFTEGVA